MKKLFLFTLILLFSFQINAQQKAKKYAVKSGKLIMELSGSTTGTKTIYFDDWGHKYYEHEKSVTVVKMFGITDREEKETTLIMNKDKYWTIDHVSGNNYKGTLAYYDMGQEIANSMTEAEQKQLADNILNSMGGQRLGTEDVIGFKCEKMTVMGAKSWIYKGVTLRSEVNVMGVESNEIATDFKPNYKVDASKFEEPQGINFEDIDARQQAYLGQMEIYEEENEEEVDWAPLSYSYEKFQSVINGFNPSGYSRTMLMNQDGQYMAIYNQGFTNILTVIATSSKNLEEDDETIDFETFNYKGKTLKYGEMEGDGMSGKGLLVPFNEHNMHIMIMSMPGKDKQSYLDYLDELDF